MNNKKLTTLALLSAATLVSVASQNVLAHTGIRDVVLENTTSFNAVNLSHGCAGNEDTSGVRGDLIGHSVLFPNAADPALAVVTNLATKATLPDLSDDIEGVVPGKGFVNLGLGLVQPGLFPNFIPLVDKDNLVGAHSVPLNRGFAGHNGAPYESAPIWQSVTSTSAYAPFNVGPVKFKSTSCAKSLKVRIASANWCKNGVNTKNDPARVDIWIGHMTAKFNDPAVMPYSLAQMQAGSVYWPTMTINRNLTTNPLDASCGAGFDLAIEPADADIDALLPMPRGPKGALAKKYFWPAN